MLRWIGQPGSRDRIARIWKIEIKCCSPQHALAPVTGDHCKCLNALPDPLFFRTPGEQRAASLDQCPGTRVPDGGRFVPQLIQYWGCILKTIPQGKLTVKEMAQKEIARYRRFAFRWAE
jgi:hypothetical protein